MFEDYFKEKEYLNLIVTYNISDDELRKSLEEILINISLAAQEDQSTYKGKILRQDFANFKKELRKKIIQNDAITVDDFINIYSSSSEINMHSLKK